MMPLNRHVDLGRGKSSYAYFHSVHEDHHVFINLHTQKVLFLKGYYNLMGLIVTHAQRFMYCLTTTKSWIHL